MDLKTLFEDMEKTFSQLDIVVSDMKKDIKEIKASQRTFDEDYIDLNKKLVDNKYNIEKIKFDNNVIKEKLFYINSYKKNQEKKNITQINIDYLEKYLRS